MKQFTFIFLLTLSIFCCSAQSEGYFPGAIIDLQGNEIECLIKPGDQKWLGVKIDEQNFTYKPFQLRGYHVKDDDFAVLKDIKIKTELYGAKYTYVFAKTISLGRINLYQVPIQTFLGGTHLTTVDIYILEKNGQQELSQVPNRMSKMRDLINKLTADEPKELDFETNKKIYHEDIPHLIKNYNIRFR